jgi:hypothetical protein
MAFVQGGVDLAANRRGSLISEVGHVATESYDPKVRPQCV